MRETFTVLPIQSGQSLAPTIQHFALVNHLGMHHDPVGL
jgi:hypothetical protein